MPLTAQMQPAATTSHSQSPAQQHLPLNMKNAESGGVTRQTTTSLTFSRGWLKQIAVQTIDIAHQGYYINTKGERVDIEEPLRQAVEGSVHYHSSHVFTPPTQRPGPGPYETKTVICYGSALQVAAHLHGEGAHVGILNSASGKTPAKFLRGTISPEECTLRATLLYPCLAQFEGKPHHYYYINNKEKYKDNNSACAIFSPHVPIIREDDVRGTLLDQYQTCSFVSIPAANAFVVGQEEHTHNIPKAQTVGDFEKGIPHENITLHDAMYDRIFRALCIFQQHGCTDLVLGAFGCGVHGNNPESVANIFREILDDKLKGYFRTVVFAIQPSRPGNYRAFTSVFTEAITCQDHLEMGD